MKERQHLQPASAADRTWLLDLRSRMMRYLTIIAFLTSLSLQGGALNESHNTPQKDWHVRWHNRDASDKDFCPDAQAMKIANATDSPRGHFSSPDDPDGVLNAFEAMGFPPPAISGGDVKIQHIKNFGDSLGAANGNRIRYLASWARSATFPDIRSVVTHEAFHGVQMAYAGNAVLGKLSPLLIEGTATAMMDRVFLRDDSSNFGHTYYDYYSDEEELSLWDRDYDGALWWSYLMEQYGGVREEPQVGVDFLQAVWRITQETDPSLYDTIQLALNEHDRITTDGPDFASVEDIYHDFNIAVMVDARPGTIAADAQILSPDRFAFADVQADEDSYTARPRSPSERSNFRTPVGEWSGRGATGVWDVQYLRLFVPEMLGKHTDFLDPEVSRAELGGDVPYVMTFHGQTDPYNTASYTLLAYKGNQLARMWTTGASGFSINNDFSVSLMQDSDDPYDLLVAVVTGWVGSGWPARVGFDFSFAYGTPTISVLDPSSAYPAYVGLPEAPERFLVRVQVDGPPELGGTTVEGLSAADFTAYVGSPAPINEAEVHLAAYVLGEYWLTIEAPAKGIPDAGPYNLTVTLGEVSATAVSSVYYQQKDLNQVITVDRSLSMTGQRIKAAKSAAQLYVDVSGTGDTLGLVSFHGDETEPNDDAEVVHALEFMDSDLERDLVREAIDGLVLDGFTSIGDGLRAALTQFVGASDAENWIILLSDGRENEALFYADVKDSLMAEGIRVMSVALGPQSDQALLQQIATDTGGRFIYVADPRSRSGDDIHRELADALVSGMEEAYSKQRIWEANGALAPESPVTVTLPLGGGLTDAVFSLHWQESGASPVLTLTRPDGSVVLEGDLDIEIFASDTSLAVHVDELASGAWQVDISTDAVTSYLAVLSAKDREGPHLDVYFAQHHDVAAAKANYGLFLHGLPQPVLAALSDGSGPIRGATVSATIEHPDGRTFVLQLHDDGGHADGFENDGIYGNLFTATTGQSPSGGTDHDADARGSYPVSVVASGSDNVGNAFQRLHKSAFHVWDDQLPDPDGDGLPTWYEHRHPCLLPATPDATADPDGDGLTNLQELEFGTDPCNADTDNGGETDGSEYVRGANPLDPSDDGLREPLDVEVIDRIIEGSELVLKPKTNIIRYPVSPDYQDIRLLRSLDPSGPFDLLATFDAREQGGIYEDEGLVNNVTYYYRVQAITAAGGNSRPSRIFAGTPRANPIPSSGIVIIEGPVDTVDTHDVTLHIRASESAIDMRISNLRNFESDDWQPLADTVAWTLSPEDGLKTVFVQLRDEVGLESAVFVDSVRVDTTIPRGRIVGAVAVGAARSVNLAGIHVQATSASGETHAVTDDSGQYTLSFLAHDTYTLTFTARGLVTKVVDTVIVSDETINPPAAQLSIRESTLSLTPHSTTTAVIVTEGQASSFRVLAEGTAPYTYSWFVNEEEVENNGPIFAYTPALDSIVHPADAANMVVEVVVDDADGNQEFIQWNDVSLRDSDQAAIINSAAIQPAQPVTTDDISLVATGSDPDGDAVSFRVSWEILDAGRAAIEGPTLSAANTAAGYRIRATIWPVTNPYGRYETLGEPATLEFEIANSAPVPISQTLLAASDTTRDIQLLATDADGDTLSFDLASFPLSGSIIHFSPSTGKIAFRPNANFAGADSFSFIVRDNSASATGSIDLTIGGWQLAIDVANGPVETLAIGMVPGASDAVDPGLDRMMPPPLASGPSITGLQHDIRDDAESATWEIPIDNTDGLFDMIFSWDAASVPHRLLLQGNSFVVAAGTQTTWTIRFGVASFDITFFPGWNLISLPIDPVDPAPSQLGEVFAWDDGYVPATTLEPGVGYFIHSPRADTITIFGNSPDSLVTPVGPGWNVVGPRAIDPFTPRSWLDAFTPNAIIIEPIWWLDDGIYKVADPLLSIGFGYWIYGLEDTP
ncbi:MAG: hypothetical protein ACI8W8_001496 [Rhodothermales bacterium]|jgi:hypothetical protein